MHQSFVRTGTWSLVTGSRICKINVSNFNYMYINAHMSHLMSNPGFATIFTIPTGMLNHVGNETRADQTVQIYRLSFPLVSSPEPSGSQGELIVYPCSVVRTSSVVRPQFQTSSPLKPIGQSKPNFMWSLLGKGEGKFV